MSKTQSKSGGKRIPKVAAAITFKSMQPPRTKVQRALKGGVEAAFNYAMGNPIGAALDVASAAYDIAGMKSGGLTARTVAAPVYRSSEIRSRGTTMPMIRPSGPDTVRVTGRAEIMRLEVGAGAYYVYDIYGNLLTLSFAPGASNGAFPLMMPVPGALPSSYSASQAGYGVSFTTPVRLRNIAMSYALYRYERIRFTFIPVVATSTAGSVTMAWTADSNSVIINNAGSSYDIWGTSPFSPMNLSQLNHFVQTPAWNASSLDVLPRKHGVCENVNDWNSVSIVTSALGGVSGVVLAKDTTTGCLLLNMSDYSTPLVAYTAGYIMMDYDITFHEPQPLTNISAIYTLTDFMHDPSNADLVQELRRRKELERKEHGFDLEKTILSRTGFVAVKPSDIPQYPPTLLPAVRATSPQPSLGLLSKIGL